MLHGLGKAISLATVRVNLKAQCAPASAQKYWFCSV